MPKCDFNKVAEFLRTPLERCLMQAAPYDYIPFTTSANSKTYGMQKFM